MAKINNTIRKKLLNEEATPQQVTDAIKKRYEVKIKYKGDENGKGAGERLIQPVTYGTMKGSGNPVIRAFQPLGDTKTKVPHWKMFRLDKIDSWKPLRNRHFDDPSNSQWSKSKYNVTGGEGAYNPNGDNSMEEVFISADFKGAKERYNDNLKKHNAEVNAQKVEQDPLYNLKKNIKNSIKGDPEIMKRVAEWQKQKAEREKRKFGKNTSSSAEMASIKDFGGSNTSQTVGPITKDNVETVQKTPEETMPKTGYKNIAKNGPMYKQEEPEKTPENNVENTETNNIENNEDNLENNGRE